MGVHESAERSETMSITINQIQNLLSTYHRKQVESRLSNAGSRHGNAPTELKEDRVFLSPEAKRIQIYQKTAEEVLSRLMQPAQDDDNGKENIVTAPRGEDHG
jgi:hypothetical protein